MASVCFSIGMLVIVFHGNPSNPLSPKQPPPRNKALLRVYYPLVSLNKALLTPYSWGGVALGGVARIPLMYLRFRIGD